MGGWPAAPILKPCGILICTCWSALSDTPLPIIVKFSFWFEPGVCASINAVLHGFNSPYLTKIEIVKKIVEIYETN